MENRTEISSLGEFGLIEHLTKNIELQNASSIVGVGDDAAVIGATLKLRGARDEPHHGADRQDHDRDEDAEADMTNIMLGVGYQF